MLHVQYFSLICAHYDMFQFMILIKNTKKRMYARMKSHKWAQTVFIEFYHLKKAAIDNDIKFIYPLLQQQTHPWM